MVCLCVKHALVKIVVHSEAFERTICSKVDNLVCVQLSPFKDGEARQKFS